MLRLASFARDLSLGNFRSVEIVWDLWPGAFRKLRLETRVRDLRLGFFVRKFGVCNFRCGTFVWEAWFQGLGHWASFRETSEPEKNSLLELS